MELTPAEQRLWDAFPRGLEVDFGAGQPTAEDFDPAAWGEDRTLRAEVLQHLMLGAGGQQPGVRRRIWISGAKIVGVFDVNSAILEYELDIRRCYFTNEPDFGHAKSRSVVLSWCKLPGLGMWSMQVDGDIDLEGIHCGAVSLRNARISGELNLNAAVVGSVTADGLIVETSAYFNATHVAGSINLIKAKITGSLELYRLHVTSDVGAQSIGLDLELASIGGNLFGTALQLDSSLDLSGTTIAGSVALSRAGVVSFVARNLRVGSHLDCEHLRATGGLTLEGAEIGGDLYLSGAELQSLTIPDLTSPDSPALGGFKVKIGGAADLTGLKASGPVDLSSAQIGDYLNLSDARITREGPGPALLLFQATLRSLEASNIVVHGTTILYGATVAGSVTLDDGLLVGAPDDSLDARYLSLNKALVCRGMIAVGTVGLSNAKIGTLVDFTKSSFIVGAVPDDLHTVIEERLGVEWVSEADAEPDPDEAHAIDAGNLSIGTDLFLNGVTATRTIKLHGATVGGEFQIFDASLRGLGERRLALHAPLLTARGGLFADRLKVDGVVDLYGADITELDFAAVWAPTTNPDRQEIVLAAHSMKVQTGASISVQTDDWIQLSSARFSGSLTLSGSAKTIQAEDLSVATYLTTINDLTVTEMLNVANATITGHCLLGNLTLGSDPLAVCFVGVGATFGKNLVVGTDPTFATFSSEIAGQVVLDGAKVHGTVSFEDTEIHGRLLCGDLQASEFIPPRQTPGLALVMLDGAVIDTLAGDLQEWPQHLSVDGLRFTRTTHPISERAARGWLGSHRKYVAAIDSFVPHHAAQPYQQLAGYLRGLGDDALARKVLRWQQQAHRPALTPLRRAGSWVMDFLAGYGYAPGRALIILLISWIGGWAWFSLDGFEWREGLVVLDTVLPTAPFGLEDLSEYQRADLGVAVTLVAIGWLLSVALLPAVTRALSRN